MYGFPQPYGFHIYLQQTRTCAAGSDLGAEARNRDGIAKPIETPSDLEMPWNPNSILICWDMAGYCYLAGRWCCILPLLSKVETDWI